jgi:CBS domain-containing protein
MSVDRRRGTSGELETSSTPSIVLSTTPGTPPTLGADLLGAMSNSDPMPSFRSKAMRRRSVAIAFNVTSNEGDGGDEASFEQSMLAMLQSAGVKSENRPFCERCRKRVSSMVVFPEQCALKVCTGCAQAGPQSEAAVPLPTRIVTTPVGSVRELLEQTRINAALWSAKEVGEAAGAGNRRLNFGDPLRYVLAPLVDSSVGSLPVYRAPPEDAPEGTESTYVGTVSIDQATFYCLERYEDIAADTASFLAGSVGAFVEAYSFAELAPRTVLETDPFTNAVWRLANHRPVGLTTTTLEHAPVTSTLSVAGALRFVSTQVLERSPTVTAGWTVADLECFTNTDVCTVSGHMLAVDALRVVRRRGVASVAVVNDAGGLVASFGPHCLRFLTPSSFKLLNLPLNSFFAEVSKLHPSSARVKVDSRTGVVSAGGDAASASASSASLDLAATLAGFLNPLTLALDNVETMPVKSAVDLLLSPANPLKLLWILAGRAQVVAVLRADRLLRYLAAADVRLRVRNLAPPPLPLTPAPTARGGGGPTHALSLSRFTLWPRWG